MPLPDLEVGARDRLTRSLELARVSRWRDGIGWLAALFGTLFLLAILDGLLAHRGSAPDAYRLLPGDRLEVNGPLNTFPPSVSALRFVSSTDRLSLTFQAVHQGFWLGFPMWRGVLSARADLQPGTHRVSILAPVAKKPAGAPAETQLEQVSQLTVTALPDAEAFRRTDPSRCVRLLNLSPGWVAAVALSALLLAIGAILLLSRRRDLLLAGLSMAEIHQVLAGEGEPRIVFALGLKHGARVGEHVALLNDSGEVVGEAEILEAGESDAVARVKAGARIRPGNMVRLQPGSR